MKYLLGDLKRNFLSRNFFIAVIGISLMYYLGGRSQINIPGMDILDYFSLSKDVGFLSELTILLSVIPSSMGFVEDLHSNFIRVLIVREGIFKYTASKVICSVLSSMCSVFLGIGLFFIILSIKLPCVLRDGTNFNSYVENYIFGGSLGDGKYFIYFFIQILMVAIVCSILSVLGLVVTTYLPNRFLGITSPMVIYFVLKNGGRAIKLPENLQIDSLLKGVKVFPNDNTIIIYIFGIFIVSMTIIGYIFYKGVKRNVYKG